MEVVQCDRCGTIVGKNSIAVISYRPPVPPGSPSNAWQYNDLVETLELCARCNGEIVGTVHKLQLAAAEEAETGDHDNG